MPMLPEEKARVKIDKQLRNAGWDIVARNEYLPNSIDGTAIRIQFKISGLSKIKDILTEINEEGKHDRNDGFNNCIKHRLNTFVFECRTTSYQDDFVC